MAEVTPGSSSVTSAQREHGPATPQKRQGGIADCFWTVSRPKPPERAVVTGDLRVDVAIIGGGYTGLSTAFHLRRADPGLEVAVLEQGSIGSGASGRNGGFVITLFGASLGLMKALHGATKVREAHDYLTSAIGTLESLIAEHGIACDYERPGFLKVATSKAYASRIQAEVELMHDIGIRGIEWIDRDAVRARIDAPGYLGAAWEPGCGCLNPGKWVDGLARLAGDSGATLYEQSGVTAIRREGGRYKLTTSGGTVTAEKIVYATNGYSHLVPGLALRQMPAFTYVVVTEPLGDEQLARIGWQGRECVEDGRNFMHYYRLTADNRILAGGGPGYVPFGKSMGHESSHDAWDHLERFIARTFPALGPVRIAHRWGGAFSMTADFTPVIGTLRGGSAIYSIGCTGHGVAMTHKNGEIIRDLVLERQTPLTDLWFVNRWALPLPPEPVRSLVARAASGAMALDDWWCDRAR